MGATTSPLTQHALALPRVVVPGLDAVLDLVGDAVGVHVLHGAVHAGSVVVLTGCRGSNYVPHLRPESEGAEVLIVTLRIAAVGTVKVHRPDRS